MAYGASSLRIVVKWSSPRTEETCSYSSRKRPHDARGVQIPEPELALREHRIGVDAALPLLSGLSPLPSFLPAHRFQASLQERVRVREMLTNLGTALPRFTSPAARLPALQCALRTDVRGQVRLPTGLLRGMRLHGNRELWLELAMPTGLRCRTSVRCPHRCGYSLPRCWTRHPAVTLVAAPPTGHCDPRR
ncbi:hypothetical protein [Streptomyces sp. NPDC060027]|uniref:hypothetical protein n=1 Tax=Streptomyces sp. NPDC060027 TaxID=3347040 RepID=UPI0036C45B49